MRTLLLIALCVLSTSCYTAASGRSNFGTPLTNRNGMVQYQYIDRNGKPAIGAAHFHKARSFSNGLAAVMSESQLWGFINKSGQVAIEPLYEEVGDFSEGLAAARLPERPSGSIPAGWMFIDTAGRERFRVNYDIVYDFSENVALAQGEKAVYLIGKEGNVRKLFDLVDLSLGSESRPKFSEGLLAVRDVHTKKYGYVDVNGKMVIAPRFDNAAPFKENVARVSIKVEGRDLLGFVRKDGTLLFPPRFDIDLDFLRNSRDFSENLAGIAALIADADEPNFIFVNKAGVTVFTTTSVDVGNFREGLAFFFDSISGKYGYLDSSGRTVIPPSFEHVADFSEGLACVAISN